MCPPPSSLRVLMAVLHVDALSSSLAVPVALLGADGSK